MPSNVLTLHLKQTFPPIIWIVTEGKGDGIESRLPFKIFSTLTTSFLSKYKIQNPRYVISFNLDMIQNCHFFHEMVSLILKSEFRNSNQSESGIGCTMSWTRHMPKKWVTWFTLFEDARCKESHLNCIVNFRHNMHQFVYLESLVCFEMHDNRQC